MHPHRTLQPLVRAAISWTLIAHLWLICAAAACPAVHEWLHPDADHADHECAITLFATGTCEDTVAPPVTAEPALMAISDEAAAEPAGRVASFHRSGVLEHAPPRGA